MSLPPILRWRLTFAAYNHQQTDRAIDLMVGIGTITPFSTFHPHSVDSKFKDLTSIFLSIFCRLEPQSVK